MKTFVGETFTLRNGEKYNVSPLETPEKDTLAVMLTTFTTPDGQKCSYIVAAEFLRGKWQSLFLSPAADDYLTTMMLDKKLPVDTWHELTIRPASPEEIQKRDAQE